MYYFCSAGDQYTTHIHVEAKVHRRKRVRARIPSQPLMIKDLQTKSDGNVYKARYLSIRYKRYYFFRKNECFDAFKR